MKQFVVAVCLLSFSTFAMASVNTEVKKTSTAKTAKRAVKAVKAPSKKKAEYGTSYSFDGASIKGKLQEGNMRRIVVENDKSIDDLLGIRKNFDDRERDEAERNLSW